MSPQRPQLPRTERRHRADASGRAAYTPGRGNFNGKGKQKRDVVSTTNACLQRSGRGWKYKVTIPAGVTGTGEQSS